MNDKSTPRILVLGAGGPSAINWIRAVKRAYPDSYIIGVDTNQYKLRLSGANLYLKVPAFADPELRGNIQFIISTYDIHMVYAAPDAGVEWLGFNADLMYRFNVKMHLPSANAWSLSRDKFAMARHLDNYGVKIPASTNWTERRVIFDCFKNVWMRLRTGAGSKGALPVDSLDKAEAWAKCYPGNVREDDWMLSEFLPGREFAIQLLCCDGNLIDAVSRERIEYLFGDQMPSGQSSSPSVAKIVRSADLTAFAFRAARAIDRSPHGIYGVDCKEDSQGRVCVTEVNVGRFYTTSDFFAEAGINLPAMYVAMVMGYPLQHIKREIKPLTWIRSVDCVPVAA